MPKITVIMPSLNVASYIRECIESVVNQTLKDIEILCIDANSTDGTREILEEYARRDDRIKILEDDRKSSGYAKNLGIDRAKGKYISIVETDDYIAPDMLERLYGCAEKNGADMAKGNYKSVLGSGDDRLYAVKAVSAFTEDYSRLIDPRTDNRYFGWDMYTWTGIYRKDFLDRYQIRHNESPGAAFQDVTFWFLTFCYAAGVCLIPEYFYFYRRDNPDASVNNPNRTYVMCDEYDFLKKRLMEDEVTWRRVLPAFYHELFRSYLATYQRLADRLKEDFADRFRADMMEGMEQGAVLMSLYEKEEWEDCGLLLKSARAFEEKYALRRAGMQRKREEFFRRLGSDKRCVIFGAGSHGTNLQIMMWRQGRRKTDAFCDNDREKWGMKFNGVSVVSPEEAAKTYGDAVFVIANKRSPETLREQLEHLGVGEAQILECRIEDMIDGFM